VAAVTSYYRCQGIKGSTWMDVDSGPPGTFPKTDDSRWTLKLILFQH
jgi:hypothetical protein